jgi:hypothetical protein
MEASFRKEYFLTIVKKGNNQTKQTYKTVQNAKI